MVNSAQVSSSDLQTQMVTYVMEIQNNTCGDSAVAFWTRCETQYPSLAPLALDLVHAPASEAYSERVFSVCGDLTTGKRNRTSKTLERRVFLKMNYKTLDELASTA